MINVFKPHIGNEEIKAVTKVLKSGWLGCGPQTKEFENKFAEYIGVKYAVGVSSATAALHLALKVFNVEKSEVISTPMTFISTNHAILYNNAIPVFADIEKDTLNIDSEKIEKLITKKTKAIIVVHFGGYPVDMDKINKLAKKYKLKVIEDAAHGCGGIYKKKKLGSLSDIGCFSFHAVKNLTTGDGGMLTTNNKKIYKKLLKLRWMGISKDTWDREDSKTKKYSWYYNVEDIGFKYQMNDITASIGLVQLKNLDKSNKKRFLISQQYNNAFKKINEIETPIIKSYMTQPACHNYVIKVPNRDALIKFLDKKKISTGVHYIPNNHFKIYEKYKGKTPISDKVWKNIVTLPLYVDLTKKDINYIIKSVTEFYS